MTKIDKTNFRRCIQENSYYTHKLVHIYIFVYICSRFFFHIICTFVQSIYIHIYRYIYFQNEIASFCLFIPLMYNANDNIYASEHLLHTCNFFPMYVVNKILENAKQITREYRVYHARTNIFWYTPEYVPFRLCFSLYIFLYLNRYIGKNEYRCVGPGKRQPRSPNLFFIIEHHFASLYVFI